MLKLTYHAGQLTLFRRGNKDCYRYASLHQPLHHIRILIDTSCAEIFVNDGWLSFSELYFTEQAVHHELQANSETILVQAYPMDSATSLNDPHKLLYNSK